jgi:hypothetical protein
MAKYIVKQHQISLGNGVILRESEIVELDETDPRIQALVGHGYLVEKKPKAKPKKTGIFSKKKSANKSGG